MTSKEILDTERRETASEFRLSDHEVDLAVFTVTEKAKEKVIKWLKGAAAALLVIVSLFGLKAYTDYQSALDSVDKKVEERVKAEVAEYQKFTDQIISALIEAKTRANQFRDEMSNLESKLATLKETQASFEGELGKLRLQARKKYEEYSLTLVELRIDPEERKSLIQAQADFISQSEAFARKIGFEAASPEILFEPHENENVQAWYDPKRKAYVIDPRWLGKSEHLPEYVAVMGRFMLLHYDRTVGDDRVGRSMDGATWNSFRMSMQAYLIETNTEAEAGSRSRNIPGDDQLYRFLKDLESRTNSMTSTRFAVELLTLFDSSWRVDTMSKVIMDLNRRVPLVDDRALEASIKAIW